MKPRALLDTNVFIYAFEFPKSNSNAVIGALNRGLFEAVITESTFKEVYRYFRRHYSKAVADDFRVYLFVACRTVFSFELARFSAKYVGLVNRKDLEQVMAAKELGIKFLVSFDRHFEGLEECVTPRRFVKLMGLKTSPPEY